MKITLTGGAGVLGRNLVARLTKDGHDVTTLDLVLVPELKGLTQFIGDIRDRHAVFSAIDGADVVVHTAAALPSYKSADIQSISVGGTQSVISACYEARIPRVFHISSSAVYGLPDIVPTPEDHPRERVDAYNCAKIDAEKICETYRDDGMIIPILRPKTFLGPHRLGIFAMLFEWAEEGHHFPLIGGGHYRSQMLDVDDFVDAICVMLGMSDDTVNDAFNIAATKFTTLHDDFQTVLDVAGHGKRIISLPKSLSIGVLRGLEIAGISPVYKRLIYKLSKDACVSTEKAQRVLNFSPKYSNTDTITRTFRWWQSQSPQACQNRTGRTSRDPWKQGALGFAKAIF